MARSFWGVDSAAPVNEQLLECVKEHYGMPEFWGRYLKTVPGAADGLTRDEIAFIRKQGINILPIYSDFRVALGYNAGQVTARNANFHAKRLGMSQDVVIFANVERFFEVDEAWIRGWVDSLYTSDYKPGFYHDPTQGNFSSAYCEAPEYNPSSPPCDSNVWAWQYGRDSTQCPIDTNLASPLIVKHLWA